jgi:hypothetical protein
LATNRKRKQAKARIHSIYLQIQNDPKKEKEKKKDKKTYATQGTPKKDDSGARRLIPKQTLL